MTQIEGRTHLGERVVITRNEILVLIREMADKKAVRPQRPDFYSRLSMTLCMRYGLNGQKPHSLDEIAARFSVTRSRVQQIEMRALRELCSCADKKRGVCGYVFKFDAVREILRQS